MRWFKTLFIYTLCCLLVVSCVDDSQNKMDEADQKVEESQDLDKSKMLKVGNQLFSIPSPIQSAKLFKELELPYDNQSIHTANDLGNYTTSSKKALNLGIYGADLGYTSLYGQEQDARSLLGAVNKLCGDLDLLGAIDDILVERFVTNLDAPDSLIHVIADFYSVGDQYLKDNDRNDIAGLVLAGGFIEALYLTTTYADDNEKVQQRIAEQKTVVNNLVKILEQDQENVEIQSVLEDLVKLEQEFENIEYEYIYARPVTQPEKKLTQIKCRTEISMSSDVLNNIKSITSSMRNKIIS